MIDFLLYHFAPHNETFTYVFITIMNWSVPMPLEMGVLLDMVYSIVFTSDNTDIYERSILSQVF